MRNNLFRLADDRILVEQLNLLLRNVHSALIPTFVLGIVLVWGLANESNRVALETWFFILMLSKLNAAFHATRNLKSPIPQGNARRLVRTLIGLNMVDGMIWGSLPWITLSNTTMAGSILVISTMAAIVGSTMSRLSPVLPIFAAFSAPMLTLVTSKVWTLGDPAYQALGAASIVYLASLSLMARNSSREIRAGIELRFENISLIEKLQEKTRIAETAQREAELANAAKSKFLAAASHDLRQPIHAQGLFLEVLGHTELSTYQRELLGSTRSALEASGEMLNTLLDFSRIEAGVIEPQRQPLRLQALLNKIEIELAPQADTKNIVYRSRETHVEVESDPLLLEMILRNLVTNAIRYTERGGVLVACRRRGDQALLEVWDTGIGIAKSNQQEIFREFHQLGNPERDRNKGLGLGLAIAQGLARTLGHELSLVSTPNHGSVFRIALPLAETKPFEQPAIIPNKVRLIEANVLVIDDDEAVRTGMRQLLHGWGCECDVAENIEEALIMTQTRAPGLVISDYRLREQRTGVEAIAALRSELGDDLPALLITGDTAPERLREAQASGIPLLHKPVLPSQLYRKLVEVLDSAEPQPVEVSG